MRVTLYACRYLYGNISESNLKATWRKLKELGLLSTVPDDPGALENLEIDLQGADLTDADLRDGDLSGADLNNAILRGARLARTNLTNIKAE